MSNVEKNGLIKGAEVLKQDVYRAITDKKSGMIQFNPVTMVHLCFVKFDGNDKIYTFINPTDKRLTSGTRVIVDTRNGEQEATVFRSIKIQRKYLHNLMDVLGNNVPLKNVLGVLETKTISVDIVERFDEDNID